MKRLIDKLVAMWYFLRCDQYLFVGSRLGVRRVSVFANERDIEWLSEYLKGQLEDAAIAKETE